MINPITYIKNFYYDVKVIWQLQQDARLTVEQPFVDYGADAIDAVDMDNTPFEEIQITDREDAMDYAQELRRGGRSCYAITQIINDNGYKVSQSTITRWTRKDLL